MTNKWLIMSSLGTFWLPLLWVTLRYSLTIFLSVHHIWWLNWVTLRYSLGHIWNPSKFGYIPQWGECSWSVHYWRLYLIRYYTLKVVKRCPQSWGYLCEWLIVTCKNLCSSHFFRNWLFLKVNAILRCHTVSKS